MPYIYRYIDLEAKEVIYIGKVTRYPDIGYDPLSRRHEQHMRDEWYVGNASHIVMQYIELDNNTDADILETWLINKYNTGQLFNKAKTGWGNSNIDLSAFTVGRWHTYQKNKKSTWDSIHEAALILDRRSEGLTFNVEHELKNFNNMIHELMDEKIKVDKLSRYDAQNDFMRLCERKEDQ